VTPSGRTHVFHQYVLRVGPALDAVLAELRRRGVGAEVYYPVPVHRQPYIRERGLHAELPETDDAAATTLALPIFPGLTVVERDLIIGAVRAAVASNVQPTAEAIGNDGVRDGAWSSPAAP
jgi:perosamine synthetase